MNSRTGRLAALSALGVVLLVAVPLTVLSTDGEGPATSAGAPRAPDRAAEPQVGAASMAEQPARATPLAAPDPASPEALDEPVQPGLIELVGFTLLLAPARAVRVSAVDDQGLPVSGVRLTARRSRWELPVSPESGTAYRATPEVTAVTDGVGMAVLAGLTPELWRLEGLAPSGLSARATPSLGQLDLDEIVELVLPAGSLWAGQVLADGAGVPGARVALARSATKTDADAGGAFVLGPAVVDRQSASVLAHANGHAVTLLSLADVPEGRERLLVLELPAEEPLADASWMAPDTRSSTRGSRPGASG